jgi:hypothetical protein
MIYDIYGKTSKKVFRFGYSEYGYFRSNPQRTICSFAAYEPVLLDTEETDYFYTGDDHILYDGQECKVERVVKTLHEDHAKVYIDYTTHLGDDEESKQRAEADEALYKQGIDKGLSQAGVHKFNDTYYSYPASAHKSNRWYQFWR